MKILITGASTYGVKNLGDDAMLLTLVQQIKKLIPKVDIVFICRHPSLKYDSDFGFRSIKNFDHDNREDSIGRYFYGFNPGDKNTVCSKLTDEFKNADLLILGGNLFMEISENSLMRGVSSYSSLMTTIAKLFGVDIAIYGLNVVSKPKSQITIDHCKYVITNSKKVSLREENALNNLKKIGINGDNLNVFSDPAWGIETSSNLTLTKKVLDKNKIIFSPDDPLITLSFRIKYWNEDHNNLEIYKQKLKKIIELIHSKLNANFLFIPNCTYRGVNIFQDDRYVHDQICKYLNSKGMDYVFQINDELSIDETLSLLNISNFHFSNRRHSCVFAALKNVNFIMIDNIGMQDHLKPILNEVDMKDNYINIEDNAEIIVSKFEEIYSRNNMLSKHLNEKTKILSRKAKEQVSYILGLD